HAGRRAALGWRRQREGAGELCSGRRRHERPREPAPGRRRQGLRRLLARAHGRDRHQERPPGQGELTSPMRVLVVDVGGTHVKVIAAGQTAAREFSSGPKLTAAQMVTGVKRLTTDWTYDAVSVGYPGPVLVGRPVAEPH